MYGIVLATVLTAGEATPAWGHRRFGCHGGGLFAGRWGGCYGCSGGYGGGFVSYGCYGCYGCWGGGYISGGCCGETPVGYGGGYPAGGVVSTSGGGNRGGRENKQIKDLKKSIEEARKSTAKRRVEALKRTIADLRNKELEQKLAELRRDIEALRGARGGGVIPLPMPTPVPSDTPPPELPPPKPGVVMLRVPAGATLYVNGKRMNVATAYLTPDLKPGRTFYYAFRVTVVRGDRVVTRVKRVAVRAGEVVRLDYEEMTVADARQRSAAAPAHFTVRLPAEARLVVHGVRCPLTSDTRSFDTPELAPGEVYFYDLEAEVTRDGRVVTESKRVAFRAGEQVTVRFDGLGRQVARR
jgi:uncharacterized protein (TIGR03000 family)